MSDGTEFEFEQDEDLSVTPEVEEAPHEDPKKEKTSFATGKRKVIVFVVTGSLLASLSIWGDETYSSYSCAEHLFYLGLGYLGANPLSKFADRFGARRGVTQDGP